ncbi:hypothetical protein ABZS66_56205 [Dactylosporangium sp. NPDC005572]|uniref:hypothetical protein n=1 Tax=Dactylosporangium sp. NPDC005572 TaxID=3156889 RepID=UPI0033B8805C
MKTSFDPGTGVPGYTPYWLEWGQGREIYHVVDRSSDGIPNGENHTYMIMANENGQQWDLLYDFNPVGTTTLQEGARMFRSFANMSLSTPTPSHSLSRSRIGYRCWTATTSGAGRT